ncbi:hypothetical protein AB0H69_49320, partial [Streptomyces phaeochromogenes]|uniref:hypothetical protein n=1 Tax=Streptomyces phaeochromogenes TaxID=1923 RepID=UPI0033DC33EA
DGDGSLGRKPIYQGLHPSVRPTAQLTREVGKSSLQIRALPRPFCRLDIDYRRLPFTIFERNSLQEDERAER